APIFKPFGLGDWRIITSLVTGFLAKESVVSTLKVLFVGGTLASVCSPDSAIALLVFCLIYTPCVAAIAAIKRELGTKWALGVVFLQCAIAYVCAYAAYGVALLF
ncbi:MAG: ferrous iron transporter B, partial [Clostridiales bacterium]|nr:ferrous iron transporter B [Candidatus Coliplasma equi]